METPTSAANGNAFTLYLRQLNGITPALLPLPGGGLTPFSTSCYGGHCDWRFPALEELQQIRRQAPPFPLPDLDCIDDVASVSGTFFAELQLNTGSFEGAVRVISKSTKKVMCSARVMSTTTPPPSRTS